MLEIQLALLRRWVTDLDKIVIVQGPFSGEYNQEDLHEIPGTTPLLIPNIADFKMSKSFKVENIVNFILQEIAIRRKKRYTFVLHSDLFPYKEISFRGIMKSRIVGRAGGSPPLLSTLTWVGIDNNVVSKNRTVFDYKPLTRYQWSAVTEEEFTKIFPESDWNRFSHLDMQDCEPGFLHTDDAAKFEEKPEDRDDKYNLLLENLPWLMNIPNT